MISRNILEAFMEVKLLSDSGISITQAFSDIIRFYPDKPEVVTLFTNLYENSTSGSSFVSVEESIIHKEEFNIIVYFTNLATQTGGYGHFLSLIPSTLLLRQKISKSLPDASDIELGAYLLQITDTTNKELQNSIRSWSTAYEWTNISIPAESVESPKPVWEYQPDFNNFSVAFPRTITILLKAMFEAGKLDKLPILAIDWTNFVNILDKNYSS